MLRRYSRAVLLTLLLAFCAAATLADDALSAAYSAILRGDYETGRAELARAHAEGRATADLAAVEAWMDNYWQAVRSREQVKADTHAWNVRQAQGALAEGQVYLALCYAERAAAYAPDEEAFRKEAWVRDLTARAEREAEQWKAQSRWSKVHAYYLLLSRLHPQEQRYERLAKGSARCVRLEVLYKDEQSLQRRMRGVTPDLLRTALRQINKTYYEEPDFKRMAVGAIDNLLALCQTQKLYDHLHGLGNRETRAHFMRKLEELRAAVLAEEDYTYQDLLRDFNRVTLQNTESVELPVGLLVTEFTEGALGELDDYTSVVWPADAPEFDKVMMGDFEGVGIQLDVDDRTGRLKVVTPLEDSPALEAGIEPDDLIVEVNGESTKGWTTDDAVRNIMGPAGTPVELTMFRPTTGQRLTFSLVRRKIVLKTVRGVKRVPQEPQGWDYMLDRSTGIAYIRLTGFHPETDKELARALQTAQQQGMRGLILDLRHNPGGLLDTAVRTVSMFLRNGEVVCTRGRQEPRTSLRTTQEPVVVDVPMVVLVNQHSASASEIVAGALLDHQRAIVLGQRTYGKGSVQRVLSLGNEARLKVTTALYYLPDGYSPHKSAGADTWGVEPTFEVALTPKEFRQVLKRETDTFVIHNGHGLPAASTPSEEEQQKALEALKAEQEDDEDGPPLLTPGQIKQLDADPIQPADADPQLETALLLLRVKLAANLPWPERLLAKSDGK